MEAKPSRIPCEVYKCLEYTEQKRYRKEKVNAVN